VTSQSSEVALQVSAASSRMSANSSRGSEVNFHARV
jgi:hypothetical protein